MKCVLSCLLVVLSLAQSCLANEPQLLCQLLKPAQAITAKVSTINFKKKLTCEVLNIEKMSELLNRRFRQENSDTKIQAEARLYKILGMIKSDYNYQQEMLKVNNVPALAYYDYETKQLYLRPANDVNEVQEYPINMIHELTRALVDQHSSLKHLVAADLTTDELMARYALVDGMATLNEEKAKSMSDFQRLSGLSAKLAAQTASSQKTDIEVLALPESLEQLFSFSNNFGRNFLLNLAAQKFDLSQEVFSNLPKSSSEILHLGKYLRHERLPELEAATWPSSLPVEQLQLVLSDRLGEYSLSTLLGIYLPKLEAIKASNAWQNDRVLLYKIKASSKYLLIWDIMLDSELKVSLLRAAFEKLNAARSAHLVLTTKAATLHLHTEIDEANLDK